MIKRIYKLIFSENTRIRNIRMYHKLLSLFLRGNKFYCNCCEKGFRKFLPKGNVKRENAMCPNCFSLERTRVLLEYLKNETNLFTQSLKLLHIAPERCLFDKIKTLNIEYIDGDINPVLARNVIDITKIKYPDNYFDLIICSHVLGHISDEQKAVKELKRVLSVNGKALIMTVIDPNLEHTFEDETIITPKDRLEKYGEFDLVRRHGLDFDKRLERAGFKVRKVDYRKSIPSDLKAKLCVGNGNRELIFECTK